MRTILVSITILITVVLSVSLGIISAYAAIQGILYAFGHRSAPREEPTPVLIAQEAALEQ